MAWDGGFCTDLGANDADNKKPAEAGFFYIIDESIILQQQALLQHQLVWMQLPE